MDKEDARYQTLEQLHERRKQVVRLHKRGSKIMKIVDITGLSYPTVRRTIDLYEQGGWSAIRPAERGRELGDARILNATQEEAIRKMICDKRPEQLKMDFCLWSRTAVKCLIEQEYQIKLGVRTVGKYLKRWGFTPQKPIKKAYEQRPEAVQAWLDEQYPAILAQAKAENGEIHWGDETALVNTDVRGRSYAPAGKTPVTFTAGGTRHKLSMIATVTNQGKTRWMIIDESFNADRLIEFLEALIKDAGKKVFLILDNLRVHHSKPVKSWVAEHSDKIALFYLPSYSPELNPEERLNADLKQAMGKKVPVRTKAKLRDAANTHMATLEKSPQRVQSFFQDPRVKLCRGLKLLGAGSIGSSQQKTPYERGFLYFRRLAVTYFHGGRPPTIIGAVAFHYRVRNGIGWFHNAVAARHSVRSQRAAPKSISPLRYVRLNSLM